MFKLLAIVAVLCATFCAGHACPSSWIRVGSKCYWFSNSRTKYKYYDARSGCQALGGDLPVISSLTESNLLAEEAKRHGLEEVWLGYFRPRSRSHNFHTVCGKIATYLNWAPGQPNDVSGSQSCVYLYTEKNKLGKWNDEGCGWEHNYVCQYNGCD